MTTALYPGSFDPIHNGHLAIIAAAARLFDRVVVAVGHNPAKPSGMFDPDERRAMILEAVAAMEADVEVVMFTGLVTVAAAEAGADCLVKGIRSATDLDAEMLQASMNARSSVPPGLPTVFLPGMGSDALVSSRYIREIASRGGDVGSVVPPVVVAALERLIPDATLGKST